MCNSCRFRNMLKKQVGICNDRLGYSRERIVQSSGPRSRVENTGNTVSAQRAAALTASRTSQQTRHEYPTMNVHESSGRLTKAVEIVTSRVLARWTRFPSSHTISSGRTLSYQYLRNRKPRMQLRSTAWAMGGSDEQVSSGGESPVTSKDICRHPLPVCKKRASVFATP